MSTMNIPALTGAYIDTSAFHADVQYIESLWQRIPINGIDLPIIDIGQGEPLVFVQSSNTSNLSMPGKSAPSANRGASFSIDARKTVPASSAWRNAPRNSCTYSTPWDWKR